MRSAGESSPLLEDPATSRGARVAHARKGTFALVVLRQQAAGGSVLRSGLLGPRSPALFSNGHRRKRWSDQGVARKRRFGRRVAFEVSSHGVLAALWGVAPEGLFAARSVRCPSSRGEGRRCPQKHRRERAQVRREGGCHCRRHGPKRENRMLGSVSVRRKVGCRSRWAAAVDPEKRLSALRVNSARRGDGRGRGSSSR
jgi:hypothetical protein